MVLIDESTWVKAGIEFTDGFPRLSCVVTNDGFSDWSTQLWDDWNPEERSTSARVRVSKVLPGDAQGPSIVFEAARLNGGEDGSQAKPHWQQIRIASLRSSDTPWKLGVFAISPVDAGGLARFHEVLLGEKVEPVHNPDPKSTK